MSADASAWVYRFSPYEGVTFGCHLAIGDSVNDQNGNEFWMSVANLARKARCSRRAAGMSVGDLLEGGFISLLEERTGVPSRYRFEFPEVEVVYEGRHRPSATCATSAQVRARSNLRTQRGDLRSHDAGPAQPVRTNPKEPKEPTASRSKRRDPTVEQQSGTAEEPNPVRSGMARIDRALRDVCPPDKNTIYGARRAVLKARLTDGGDVELALAAIRQGAPSEGAPLRADRAIDAMERGTVPQGARLPYQKPFVSEVVEITDEDRADSAPTRAALRAVMRREPVARDEAAG